MTLKLTDFEKGILVGSDGKLKQKAMEKIVEYANILGAEELCEVTKAHLFCGAHGYLEAVKSDDIEEVISQMHLCSSEKLSFEKMACFCQSDCGPMDPINFAKMGCIEKEGELNREYLDYYLDAGINLVGSCVPYLTGFIPLMGEHYVSSESHAILVLNSIFGACGNADGLEIGFWSAICGRIPKWGNHIMSNRKGTHVFNINCKAETNMDWDLMGYTIGRKLPAHAVPILNGNFNRPDIDKLKYCYAAMATTSGPEMCHIVGITPEARTLEEALGGVEPNEVIEIGEKDIEESRKILCEKGNEKIYYISLGCPHYSIEELRKISDFLEGKKVSEDIILHVWTANPIKETADRCKYTEKIENAGGVVLTSSCPLTSDKKPEGAGGIAFDSAKQAHYIKPGTSAKVYYGSLTDCLKSAISGKWEGK